MGAEGAALIRRVENDTDQPSAPFKFGAADLYRVFFVALNLFVFYIYINCGLCFAAVAATAPTTPPHESGLFGENQNIWVAGGAPHSKTRARALATA